MRKRRNSWRTGIRIKLNLLEKYKIVQSKKIQRRSNKRFQRQIMNRITFRIQLNIKALILTSNNKCQFYLYICKNSLCKCSNSFNLSLCLNRCKTKVHGVLLQCIKWSPFPLKIHSFQNSNSRLRTKNKCLRCIRIYCNKWWIWITN